MALFRLKLASMLLLCLAAAWFGPAPSYAERDYAHMVKRQTLKLQAFWQNCSPSPCDQERPFCTGQAISFEDIASKQSAAHIMRKPGSACFSSVDTGILYLSMTFDDCPHGNTSDILDVLKAYDMRATFFVLGVYALNNPDLTKRMVDEGHTIANHTYDHTAVTALSPEQLERQIRFTESIVYEITGKRTILFRPPYGLIKNSQIGLIRQMGYSTVLWSVDTRDYVSAADSVRIAQNAGPGDIVLFHTKPSTRQTIEEICAYYQQQGLVSVPVEELLALALADKEGVEGLRGGELLIN